MKAAFYTLGCKVNQYESAAMAQALEKNGVTVVPHTEKADIFIINSCTVTAESERKTRQAVRRFHKNNPDSIIVLTGCMTQANPDSEKGLPEADIVMGNKNNHRLYGFILQFIKQRKRVVAVEKHRIGDKFTGDKISTCSDRTRANVKIEDGCNRFCSYCIIPYARGRVRSKPLEELISEVTDLANNGFKEIVLVGINLSAYGSDIDSNLVEAVRATANVKGIERVRLGSLEPDHITYSVIEELSKIEKLCPQFHISLQSGCDKTLKKMNRHYNTVEYEDLCLKLRSTFPDATITTDVMVGFPDESESDFEISLNFVKKIKFEKVHIFPYSRRPGTAAAGMENQVGNSEKQRRAEIMAEKCEKIRKNFLKKQVGKTLQVLLEENHEGFARGYTENYIPVRVDGKSGLGEIVNVKITGTDSLGCVGEVVE